jgi:hypothetical protein
MADEHFDLADLRRRWLPAPAPSTARTHPKLREVAPQRDPFVDVPTLLSDLRTRVSHDLPTQWPLLEPFLDEITRTLAELTATDDPAQKKVLAERANVALWRVEELLEVYYFLVNAATL